MTLLQLELTKLIGKKELTFGCKVEAIDDDDVGIFTFDRFAFTVNPDYPQTDICNSYVAEIQAVVFVEEIIGHPATLSDFHRYMNNNPYVAIWEQTENGIYYEYSGSNNIPYDSSKELLEQSDDILKQIIELVKANSLSNQ